MFSYLCLVPCIVLSLCPLMKRRLPSLGPLSVVGPASLCIYRSPPLGATVFLFEPVGNVWNGITVLNLHRSDKLLNCLCHTFSCTTLLSSHLFSGHFPIILKLALKSRFFYDIYFCATTLLSSGKHSIAYPPPNQSFSFHLFLKLILWTYRC